MEIQRKKARIEDPFMTAGELALWVQRRTAAVSPPGSIRGHLGDCGHWPHQAGRTLPYRIIQCCGSGSALVFIGWIRIRKRVKMSDKIRKNLVSRDTDLHHFECGSGFIFSLYCDSGPFFSHWCGSGFFLMKLMSNLRPLVYRTSRASLWASAAFHGSILRL